MNPQISSTPRSPARGRGVEFGRRLRPIGPGEAAWWESVLAYGPDHPSLIGTVAIAEAMRRRPQTVRLWRSRGAMPLPVIVRGRLRHLRREVQAWATARGRDPARLHAARLRPAAAPDRGHTRTPAGGRRQAS